MMMMMMMDNGDGDGDGGDDDGDCGDDDGRWNEVIMVYFVFQFHGGGATIFPFEKNDGTIAQPLQTQSLQLK